MKLLLGLVGVLAAIALTFVGLPMMLLGGGPAKFGPVAEIAAMVTPENASESTKLSNAERDKAMALCLATFNEQSKPDLADKETIANLRATLQGLANSRCGCMIGQIVRTTNTMGFAMAMSRRFVVAKDLDPKEMSIGQETSFSEFDDFAQKMGVSEQQMAKNRVQELNAVVGALKACL